MLLKTAYWFLIIGAVLQLLSTGIAFFTLTFGISTLVSLVFAIGNLAIAQLWIAPEIRKQEGFE